MEVFLCKFVLLCRRPAVDSESNIRDLAFCNDNTVSPYLIVNGASGAIEFLKRVFGAIELRRFSDAAGKIMHAEVRIDDTVVMIADGVEG